MAASLLNSLPVEGSLVLRNEKGNGSNTGILEVNGVTYILGGADVFKFPPANERATGVNIPSFDGDVSEYVDRFDSKEQLYNSVKICEDCHKVCAYSMEECNGCGCSIEQTMISQSNNILVGFIHGISRGPFSLKVSMRHESHDFIVFDDPLAMTRAHVCAIPTGLYVPDLRYLFEHPRNGLQLVRKLSQVAWEAIESQFIEDESWISKAISIHARTLNREIIRQHLFTGFNLPPSQSQLHLQCLLPPFTPFHYGMFRAGHHFTHHRAFPLCWVEEALQELVHSGHRIQNATSLNSIDLCNIVKELTGIDYDKIHTQELERYARSHELFSNYSCDDFTYALSEKDHSKPPLNLETLITTGVEEEEDRGISRKQIDDQDKLVLQSYGRPYDDHGRPSGVYYSFPKPSPLPMLNDDDA